MISNKWLKSNRLINKMLLLTFVVSVPFAQADSTSKAALQKQIITPSNQHAVIAAPATNFTGQAHFSRYPIMPSAGDVAPAIVTFSPNSRTHWHIHQQGQYLIVTEGEGRIQTWGEPIEVIKKGDVIWCPPGVKHWHGASSYSSMTHVTMSPVGETSPTVIWLEAPEFVEAQTISMSSQHTRQTLSATVPFTQQQLSLIPIASYTASGNLTELETALNNGLDTGLSINEIKEAITHLYAYAGFPRSLNGLTTLQNVLIARLEKGIADEQGAKPTPILEDINYYQLGTETMAFLTQASAQRPLFEFAPSIDYALKAHLFGYLFSRDNLSYTNRELVTISVLSTLSLDGQLRSHLNVGKNLGMTASHFDQIIQTLEQINPQAATNIKMIVVSIM